MAPRLHVLAAALCCVLLGAAPAHAAMPRLERTAVNATALYPDGAGSPTTVPLDGTPVSVASRRVAGLEAGETLAGSAGKEGPSGGGVRGGAGDRGGGGPFNSR